MPVEISELDEIPEWMRDRLARGEAEVRIGGRPATPAEFLAAVEAAGAADEDDEPRR